jgi:hypothetical protein
MFIQKPIFSNTINRREDELERATRARDACHRIERSTDLKDLNGQLTKKVIDRKSDQYRWMA